MAFFGGLDCGDQHLTWAGLNPQSAQFSEIAVQESRREAEEPWNVLLPVPRLVDRSLIAEFDQLRNHRVLFNLAKACKQHLQHLASPYSLMGVAMPYAASPLLRAVVRLTLAGAMELRSIGNRVSDWVRVWEIPVAAAAGWWASQAPSPTTSVRLTIVTGGENCVEWTRVTVGPQDFEVCEFAESPWDGIPATFTKSHKFGPSHWLIDERLPQDVQARADQCRGTEPRETSALLRVLIAQGSAWLTSRTATVPPDITIRRVLPRAVGLLVRNIGGNTYWMTLAQQGERMPERGWDRRLRCTVMEDRSPEVNIACWSNGVPPGDWVREARWLPHARWWQTATAIKYSPTLTGAQLALTARETFNGWHWEATTGKAVDST